MSQEIVVVAYSFIATVISIEEQRGSILSPPAVSVYDPGGSENSNVPFASDFSVTNIEFEPTRRTTTVVVYALSAQPGSGGSRITGHVGPSSTVPRTPELSASGAFAVRTFVIQSTMTTARAINPTAIANPLMLSLAMQPIPDFREGITEDVSDRRSDENDCNRCSEVKRLHDEWNADHMRPQREIDERLRPSEPYKNSPDDMHATDELPDGEPSLFWIKVIHTDSIMTNLLIVHLC